jgi:hypothetical protein
MTCKTTYPADTTAVTEITGDFKFRVGLLAPSKVGELGFVVKTARVHIHNVQTRESPCRNTVLPTRGCRPSRIENGEPLLGA